MRRSQEHIESDVGELRRFVQRPRTLDEISVKFGWSNRTVLRRLHEVGGVWRCTPMGGRTCSYVATEWKA